MLLRILNFHKYLYVLLEGFKILQSIITLSELH